MRRIGIVLAVLCLLCASCAPQVPLTRQITALDTVCTFKLYGGSQVLLDEAVNTVAEYEALWSRTVETSDIARLNDARGETVAVAAETSTLLETAREWSSATDGAFDITIAPYKTLWETATCLPTEAALLEAGACVGMDKLRSSPWRLEDGAQLDLGAIAKGAIADKVVEQLKAGGCTGALLDFGGNVTVFGSKPDGSAFKVAIADPQDPKNTVLTVEAADVTLATSGSYERFYELEGKRLSHILDPSTGQPVDNGLLSVTVVAPCGATADALSTACFVMGLERGKAFIEACDGVEAVFVTEGDVLVTDGLLETVC